MAGISVTYNGVDLAQWMVITDVQRNIGANHTNTLQKVGKSDGQMWQYSSLDSKTIVISGLVQNDNLAVVRRELGAALEHDGPAPLVLGDDISVYYNALADGQASISEDWRSGNVSITFIVPDGVAHAVTPSTFNNHGSDGLMTDKVVVSNKGSYKAYPVITAKMIGENGVVSLVNSEGGAMQFGNPEELDGETLQRNERALDLGFDHELNGQVYNQGASNYPNYGGDAKKPNKRQGTVTYGLDPYNGSAVMPKFENASDDPGWGGPSLYWTVKPNTAKKSDGNFIAKSRFMFRSDTKSAGRIEHTVQSGDTVVLESVVRDSSQASDTKVWECWVGGKCISSKTLNNKIFNRQWYEIQMVKMGNKIKFQLAPVIDLAKGNNAVVTNPVVVNGNYTLPAVDGCSVWFENWKRATAPVMSMTDFQFIWVNVDYWSNIINLYKKDDVVTIDTYNHSVMLNGVIDNSLQTVGNDWDGFALPTGDTTIQLVTSSWADMFDCSIELREAYV